jgi:hypothetical protein
MWIKGGSRCTTEAVNVDRAEACQNDKQYGTEGVYCSNPELFETVPNNV